MNITEGLLIVIIIILIVTVIMRDQRAKGATTTTREWDCIDRKTGDTTAVKMQYETQHGSGCKCPKCSSPEANSLKENAEFMTAGCDNDKELHNMCGEGDFAYATNEFGAPGLSFVDWVASNSLDTAVLKNHGEFVKDRLGNNTQNITGRTYAIPDDIETDAVFWIGLRRPEAVPVCSPTQVSDVNYNWYGTKPKFTWSSS